MNIYEKIDNMFENNNNNQEMFFKELLSELKEIKNILKFQPQEYNRQYKKSLPKEYYDFVKNFKNEMKENERMGIYPEFEFEGFRLGVNSDGLLYDKDSLQTLPTFKAFEIFEKLYQNYKIQKEEDDIF